MSRFKAKPVTLVIIVSSLLGVADMSYLTSAHFNKAPLICGAIPALSSCNAVASSAFSLIYGVPVSLIGLIFYLMLLGGIAFYCFYRSSYRLLSTLFYLTLAGLAFSLYLVYTEAEILHQFCQYCLSSDILTVIIFFSLWVALKKNRM